MSEPEDTRPPELIELMNWLVETMPPLTPEEEEMHARYVEQKEARRQAREAGPT